MQGKLIAQGTAEQPITLDAANRSTVGAGWWSAGGWAGPDEPRASAARGTAGLATNYYTNLAYKMGPLELSEAASPAW